jgi:hypothetical protein
MKMLTEQLIASAKLRTLAPISQQTFQDSDVIIILNEEMSNFVIPAIERVREDMWLKSTERAIVPGVPRYILPERALGEALKVVFYKNDEGSKYELARLKVSDTDSFSTSAGNERPSGIFLEGAFIRLVPKPSAGGSLEMWYYQRPNQLVETTRCGKITNIVSAAGTTTFTVDTNLIGEAPTGSKIDIISNRSPFVIWSEGVTTSLVNSTTVEVATSSIVDEASTVLPQIGDYICAEQTTNIPQLPQEFHPILAQAAACRLLSALGDLGKLQEAQATRDRMMNGAMTLIANRIEGSLEYVNNKYGFNNATKKYFGGY